MSPIRRIAPAFCLFQVSILAAGWILFVAFGTLPAVLPSIGAIDAAWLIAVLSVALAAAFGAVLVARSLVIAEFGRIVAASTRPVDKNVAAFVYGPGLLAAFSTPFLSLLLVSMISVAGPLASAIALGLVVGGIMSAANARAVYDLIVKTPVVELAKVDRPKPYRTVSGALAIIVCSLVPSISLTSQARTAALSHVKTALAMTSERLAAREMDLDKTVEVYQRRMRHTLDMLRREEERTKAGHASQAEIDTIKTHIGELETASLRARSDVESDIARAKRELEDLQARRTALSSVAPALVGR